MQLLCLRYPDRGSPGRKESGPTTAPAGGYAPGPISGPITDGEEEHPSSGTQNAECECMNTMPPARMAEAQIIRFWALQGRPRSSRLGCGVVGANR